jgi:hypothetical protein
MLREFDCFVGQVGNLPPIENRRRARPEKHLRSRSQSSLHRIRFNVANNPQKLGFVTNQPIITLVLPKRTASKAEHFVALPSSESLERLHYVANVHERCHQEVHVVRHDYVRVQFELPQISILNSLHHDIGNFRPLEKQRPGASIVKDVIDGDEGPSGVCYGREASISRQTPIQSLRKEYWLTNGMIVRQPTAMERAHRAHREGVDLREKLLTFVGQVGNLPPLEKRQMNGFVRQQKADFQSAAGYQPALQSLQ